MEVISYILKDKHLQNTCFLCFNECENSINIDEFIEIHDENSTFSITLRNITKYMFSLYDIILNEACNSCSDLIIKMYCLLKKALSKIEALDILIDKVDNEALALSNTRLDKLFININEHKKGDNYKTKKLNLLNKVTNDSNKALICDVCGKEFKKTTSLKTHLNSHKEKECPYCFKTLKFNSHYKIHIKNHIKLTKKRKSMRYKCDDCGHESHNKVDLKSHMYKYHLHIKPYDCHICDKGFYSKRNLNDHISTHKSEASITCEVCGDHFSCKKSLDNHLKLHTGERPYKCDVCYQSFVAKCRRNEHMKRKHGERQFSCNICDKNYSLQKALNHHIRTIHGPVNNKD